MTFELLVTTSVNACAIRYIGFLVFTTSVEDKMDPKKIS